ncbi:MAG: phosphohydrolase, partial [Acutalibacteraceae bacterium]|nr:phosphohydrolase [Acutalibacteraceae bacterium]
GITGIKHIFDGYDYMLAMGEIELANICLTHSFPLKNINSFFGKFDCTTEQIEFLKSFLNTYEYNNYDKLIQLCDAISLPNGACIMEKRFVDVALRHGVNELTIKKWKSFIEIKKYFDELCGCDIYSLLPNVLENSTVNLI